MICPAQAISLDLVRVYSDHQRLEARSLAMHCLVAKRLRANPALIGQARTTIARWRAQADKPLTSVLCEWEQILQSSLEEVASFVVSTHEDATRLRQSSPFTNILTPEERTEILRFFAVAGNWKQLGK